MSSDSKTRSISPTSPVGLTWKNTRVWGEDDRPKMYNQIKEQVIAINQMLPDENPKCVIVSPVPPNKITISRKDCQVIFHRSSDSGWKATVKRSGSEIGSKEVCAEECWNIILTFLVPSLRCVLHLTELLFALTGRNLAVTFIETEKAWQCESQGKWVKVKLQGAREDIVFWSSKNNLRIQYPALEPVLVESPENPLQTQADVRYNTLSLSLLYVIDPSLMHSPSLKLVA